MRIPLRTSADGCYAAAWLRRPALSMLELFSFFLVSLSAVFFVVDPVGVVPIPAR